MPNDPKQTLFEALADNTDADLVILLKKAIGKWERRRGNAAHPAPNVAVMGSLLYCAADAATSFFDANAGRSAVGTLAEYLVHQVDVLYRDQTPDQDDVLKRLLAKGMLN